ncbi:MAG: PKD domain-containing protein [Flavobacteriales bacterium]|nr:PKD domain-containing protein [Flavobacteriales bacterium]
MKRTLLFWLLLMFWGLGFNAFSQTANITQGCAPLAINFTAPAGSGPSHFWDFGDGATATLQNPQNTFTDPGTYVVEYHATAAGPVIGTVTINIYDQPIPAYTATPETGCAPLNVSFDDATVLEAGISITGYTWVFGDGAIASGSSPSHWFTTPGSFYVSLEIQTNMPSCDFTEVYNDAIIVTNGPTVTFTTTPNPATACDPPLNVSFTNNSSSPTTLTYLWDFGNGNTSTDEDPAAQTYSQNGNYVVTLTATDPDGCSGTFQRPVTVGAPTTDFNIPDTVCLGATVTMDNLSTAGSYQWVFAAGNTPTVSGQPEPQVIFNTPGLQNVSLTTTSGVCSSTHTVQILVEDPSAEFTSTPSYSCSEPLDIQFTPANSGYAQYLWTFGDSTTSSLVNPLHTYMYNDTNVYALYGMDTLATQLIVISSAGCRDTVQYSDTLWLPTARFFPSVADGCAPLTVTFADSSSSNEDIVSWEWHLGDGTVVTSSDGADQTVTFTQPGHYISYLIIVNAAGCTDTSYNVPTIVGTALSPDFTVDVTTVCPGDPVQFTDQTAMADSIDYWHYYSETNRQFHCFDDPNPTWSYTNETGPMDVTLIVGFNGCYSSTTINDLIQVNGPVAELFFNCECETPFDVAFEDRSHDATDIIWDFGDGTTSTDPDPLHTYAVTGDYTVVLTATNSVTGCPTSYDTAVVHIREIRASIQSDTILCRGVASPFSGAQSQDVYSECWNGYTWQFDDPTMRPITTTNASYPIGFQNSGNVGIRLIVTDINGCKDTANTHVSVYGIDAAFSASDNHICSPNDVDFTDLSTSDTTISSWVWSFGDLSFGSVQNPTHTYNNFIDTMTINMIVSNAVGCVDTAETMITMYSPVSNVSSSPFFANICAGQSVNFTATNYTTGGSSLSFDWDFMDGGSSQLQNPSHQFNDGGTYNVTLNFTEIASGCTGSATRTVNVQDYPQAGFTSDGDTSVVFCNPQNVIFTDTTLTPPSHTTQWNFGNGGSANGVQSGTLYNVSGEYTVTMIVTTSYGCSDTTQRVYNVIGPQGSFTIDVDTICRGEEITFTLQDTSEVYNFVWDFGDGNSAENVNPIAHTYTFVPPSGQTVGKLIVSGLMGGCPDQSTIPIYIHEVVADFIRNDGIDTALCFQPFPITNTSLNADVFYWDFGFGPTSNVENPGILNFPEPGTYDVLLGVKNNILGCNDTIVKTVVLHPIPTVESLGDTICEGNVGDLQVLNVESTSYYVWHADVAVADSNAVATTSAPLLTTDYEVLVLDTNGCSNLDTATIFVINPLVLADWDTTIVIGDSICLPIDAEAGLYMFEWTPTDGLDCDTCGSPCLQPLEKVTYSVTVTDILGCFTANADYTVDIYPETFLAMPTTFTPNGDGANDIISLEGWGIKELLEFRIFDRWGEEIFMTTDKDQGWDGYYKGVLQNNDVYAYKIRAYTWRDELKTLEGYINLMR